MGFREALGGWLGGSVGSPAAVAPEPVAMVAPEPVAVVAPDSTAVAVPEPVALEPVSATKPEPVTAVIEKPAVTVTEKPASMGIMEGADGKRSMTWTNHSYSGWGNGYLGYRVGGMPGSEYARERSLVSALSSEMVTTDSTIAGMVETYATQAVGNGLTLSAKPDAAALNITPEEAREFSDVIERQWRRWCLNPIECDASGRHTLHQLALAAYKSYQLTGESVVAIDWQRVKGATTATKVKLLDSRQIDQSKTQMTESGSVVQGVAFDKGGRVTGYFIRPYQLGTLNYSPATQFVPAHTSWGRPRLLHLFDLVVPGQIRGLSPLVASLTPAKAKAVLREYTLSAAFVQTMFAASVESDMPDALKGLNASKGGDESGIQGIDPQPSQSTNPEGWYKAVSAYYDGANRVSLNPGVVNHLYKGDSLKIHRSETPNSNYGSIDSSMLREAAKASGGSYEEISGDFSKTSFSASRLALDLPFRVTERKRESVAIRFYQTVYRCWLEEQLETGAIVAPKNAPAFWEAVDAYTNAKWRGKGKAVADPLKQAQADILEIENGLATFEEKLGERGYDFEEVVAQRAAERRVLEEAGLNYPVPKNRDDWKSEDDTATKP